MGGRYDFFNTGSGGRLVRDEDFEEDVWSVVMDTNINNSTAAKVRKPTKDTSPVSSSPTLRRLPTTSRMIPRANNSSQSQEAAKLMQQSSAPVNIPDRPKIYQKNPRKGEDNYNFRASEMLQAH